MKALRWNNTIAQFPLCNQPTQTKIETPPPQPYSRYSPFADFNNLKRNVYSDIKEFRYFVQSVFIGILIRNSDKY
jgi:hypothetical protein